MEIALELIST